MTSIGEFALRYAAAGFHVFPCLPRSKAPDGALVPHGVKEATTNETTIRRWWRRSPNGNVAIAVGVGALFGARILDVDPKNGGDRELERLVARHGALPISPAQRSGSGGLHLILRWPSGDTKTKIGPGVEILGPGRYFVAAPSVHPLSGARYAWTTEPDTPIAAAPAWLLERARRHDGAETVRPAICGGGAYARGALLSAIGRVERAASGDRNNQLNREAFGLARFVRSGELDEGLVRRALVAAARVAGLTAAEADKTISSALRARRANA